MEYCKFPFWYIFNFASALWLPEENYYKGKGSHDKKVLNFGHWPKLSYPPAPL